MALERRDVEAALRSSEDRFRTIFGAISEGIFIADAATGRISDVNGPGAAMLSYAVEDLIGRDIEMLSSGVPPYTLADARVLLERAIATGQPQRFDWDSRSKDGSCFPTEIVMQPAMIAGQSMVIAVVRDLSERQAMEAQLRQAQKMEAIGHLTGGIAHDFNNLLGVIIGNLDLLRGLRPGDRDLEQLSDEALQASLRGADLTRRLLAFARRQPLQPRQIDVNALIRESVKLFKRLLGEHIAISLKSAPGPCCVLADPAQLEAALSNLFTNARDAMPRGGKLLINTRRLRLDAGDVAERPDLAPGEYVVIEVTDTGVGMTPEIASQIFEPFFTTKPRDQGTGLGLSMVFGFLKQSGGHASAYSEVGVGTTLRLYLPFVAGAETPQAATVPPTHRLGRGETVLVVEDNAPLRRIAVRQLKELGYRAIEAKNSVKAMANLEAHSVDVLFTDVIMPGGCDGFELAAAAVQRWPAIKVLITSGFPETRLMDAHDAGRFRLLGKPYRKDELAAALQELLDVSAPSLARH
jgi:PAS domain S-box-containing protein